MADSSQSSTNSSASTGSTYLPDYPQWPMLQTLANYAQSIAGTTLGWAQNAYARGSQITDEMLRNANVYASPERIKSDMGMAEAGVMQASDAARQNSIRDLQSYGIDPSAGRYAGLDQAERTRAAAAAAGAGNQQRMATEATGRAMKSEAANLELANNQVGANMFRVPGEYLNTARSALAYPPLGHTQQSASGGQSSGRSDGGQGGNRGGGQQGGRAGGGGEGENNSGRSGVSNGPGAFMHAGPSEGGGGGALSDNFDPYGNYGDYMGGYAEDPGNSFMDGNQNYTGDLADPVNGDYTGDYGGIDPGNSFMDGNQNYTGDLADPVSGDYSEGYAAGGAIPDDSPTTGGDVDQSLSPSGGQETDDIPANLNANEFVIPRDVALWKGQEFFQKLIAQARQARIGAPAKGKPGQQPARPAAFVSQRMAG